MQINLRLHRGDAVGGSMARAGRSWPQPGQRQGKIQRSIRRQELSRLSDSCTRVKVQSRDQTSCWFITFFFNLEKAFIEGK